MSQGPNENHRRMMTHSACGHQKGEEREEEEEENEYGRKVDTLFVIKSSLVVNLLAPSTL